MKDDKDIHKEFELELSQLLIKWQATISVDNFGSHWIPDIRPVVRFKAIDKVRYYSQVIIK